MTCQLCQSLPTVAATPCTLVLHIRIAPIKAAALTWLREQCIEFAEHGNVLVLNNQCVAAFIRRFVDELQLIRMPEMHSVTVQIIAARASITYATLEHVYTLHKLYYLIQSNEITSLLSEGRLTTHFQPIVSLQSHNTQIYAYECLARGNDSSGAPLRPDRMFDIARHSDLIFYLDREARASALRHAAHHAIGEKLFINFIPTTIYNPEHCLRDTFRWVQELGLKPQDIVFEVVETEQVQDVEHLKNVLAHYKEHGYSVALDDFGSGYSSLRLLAALQPDYVKIDMDIVRDIHCNSLKQAILKAVMQMTTDQGITVLAEGIETEEEHAYCVAQGVDLAQGYFYAKPSAVPLKRV
ncbi:EAL domain-containing protein [Chrysiogenes arsenatis]|uniref:EAL domain-containing protein n=1 Tax=Chrysiogenes arsenatis TaxID=309797 RepID=UPI0004226F55|nr:EAL domain-containing protein [Chrysiogenes arsenatis]